MDTYVHESTHIHIHESTWDSSIDIPQASILGASIIGELALGIIPGRLPIILAHLPSVSVQEPVLHSLFMTPSSDSLLSASSQELLYDLCS